MPRCIVCALVALLFAACASAPPEVPAVPVPASFKEAAADSLGATASDATGRWWQVFGDAQLDRLVEQAGIAAPGLQAASARVAEARALARAAGAARSPQLGLRSSATRQGGPLVNAAGSEGTLLSMSADLAIELDLSGRLGHGTQAAQHDVAAREAAGAALRLRLQAEVARSYLALRGLDHEAALLRETVTAQQRALALAEQRQALGSIAELDVLRQRSELAAIEGERFAIERERQALEHQLAVLTGGPPSSFTLEADAAWQAALPSLPAGLPSRLLARRADLAEAQQMLRAAQLRAGIAADAWLPNIMLTGSAGQAAPGLGDLLRLPARTWGLGALLALPLLDGGRRDAMADAARAALDLAAASYRGQVLDAFKEVEDELSALRTLANQELAASQAAEAAARVLAIAQSRYRAGFGTQLEWLDAERSALRVRRQMQQLRSMRYQRTTRLIAALGGGWD